MKSFGTIICILLLGLQCFGQAIILIQFTSNQAMIAATLCENRNRPALHCNGKCQLAKKMSQEDPAKQSSNKAKLSLPDTLFTAETIGPAILLHMQPREFLTLTLSPLSPAYLSDILRPPCV